MSNIQSIIKTGEDVKVEFKSNFSNDVMVSLVAFANTKGGTVYIELSDDDSILGLSFGKETLQNWINEIKNKTTPMLIPEVDVLQQNNKTIVALSTTEYPIKPIATQISVKNTVLNALNLMRFLTDFGCFCLKKKQRWLTMSPKTV